MVIGLIPGTVLATGTVATIGNTQYETLQAAVVAAQANDTITLTADIKITTATTFTMAEGITLDLNGNTIQGDDGKAIFTGTNITIKNGKVTGVNGSTLDYYPITIEGGSATLEGLTFTNSGVKIRNGATVTLRNNEITANQNKYKNAVWAYGKAKVTIESGTYYGGKNGYDVFAEGGAKITVLGGTYKFTIVENYVAEDLEVEKNEEGKLEVVPTGVAAVNGKYYKTLQEAIAAANAGDTVTLLANIEATKQILINKSLTLGLGEYTISGCIAGDGLVRICAEETEINVIISATTGGIETTGNSIPVYAGHVEKAKTNVTIHGGNYISAWNYAVYQNNGLCTITDGTFKSANGASLLESYDANDVSLFGQFKISGGSFYGMNPACMDIFRGHDHIHEFIADGKTTEYKDGWFKVVDGTCSRAVTVGVNCYESLEAAVAMAKAGDTILLNADCTIDLGGETLALPNNVTLDLNGKTLTVPYQKTLFAGENITIKNGTITNGDEQLQSYGLYLMSGSFTLEDVTTTNGINIQTAEVTLKNVNVTNPNSRYYAVYAGAGAKVTILSGTYQNPYNNRSHPVLYADSSSTITVCGGTYNKMPTAAYIAEGYYAFQNGSTYTVAKYVMNYQELVAAIEAAKAGDTITLGDTILTGEQQVLINKSLILDLGTQTINGSVANDGVVRICGTESIEVTINATTGAIINNSAAGYAINSGNIENIEAKTNLTINGGIYSATQAIYQNNGLCTINGGTYSAVDTQLTLNNKDYYLGDFMVNGGKFYRFNPACMSINKGEHHNHDNIGAGLTTTYANGWYTVVEGTTTFVAQVSSKYESLDRCYTDLAAIAEAKAATVASEGAVIKLIADCTLDVNGETITLPDYATLDLNGYTLTVPYQKTLFAGENITIKNGTITTGENKNYALYIMSGSFTVENVTVEGGINVQAGNVTLKDVNAANRTSRYYAVYAAGSVIIESGTFKNDHSSATTTVYGNVTIYSGTFSKMPPAEMLADNRHVVMGSSAYTVIEGFLNAVAAAEAGNTVYLMSDINVAETILIDKDLTLDLGNSVLYSTAKVAVYANGGDLTINADYRGKIATTGTVAVGQDNGVCTINGGKFEASGETTDVANGKPVRYRYTLDNSNTTQDGITGSFVINGGEFYGFNPACMAINPNDIHDHDSIKDGYTVSFDLGWFKVVAGELKYTIVCDCDHPAPSHEYCFATKQDAEEYMSGINCSHDKVVEITETEE